METCRLFIQLLREESGVTAIEYALLGGLIAVVIVASVAGVGEQMAIMYDYIADNVENAISGG